MTRTNREINDEYCSIVMSRFNLKTKREAVDLALRLLTTEPMSAEEALAMRGSGWIDDFGEMRASQVL